jgi:CubicO group peptidase (beta-lactamase class C family)
MILRHSSGIDIIADKLKIVSIPGSIHDYSNVSMNFLGFIMEQITKTTLDKLASKYVFNPLKMTHSSLVWESQFELDYAVGHTANEQATKAQKRDQARAAGSLVTTAADYGLFVSAINSGRLLQSKSNKEMLKTQINIESERGWGPRSYVYSNPNKNINLGWGLGVGTFLSPYGPAYFHSGNITGWKNYFVSYPKQKIAVIFLSNSDNLDPNLKQLLKITIADTYSPLDWLGCND